MSDDPTILHTREDCRSKAKVFARLQKNYGSKRKWTVSEFNFSPPAQNLLDGVRPPYDVRGTLVPGNNAVMSVFLTGIEVASGKNVSLTVGSIKNH